MGAQGADLVRQVLLIAQFEKADFFNVLAATHGGQDVRLMRNSSSAAPAKAHSSVVAEVAVSFRGLRHCTPARPQTGVLKRRNLAPRPIWHFSGSRGAVTAATETLSIERLHHHPAF